MAETVYLNGNAYTPESFSGNNYASLSTGFFPALQDFVAHGAGLHRAASSTSLTLGTGLKSLTITKNRPYFQGSWLRIEDATNATRFMEGAVVSHAPDTGSLTVDVAMSGGSGSSADWMIYGMGKRGPVGDPPAAASAVQSGIVQLADQGAFDAGADAVRAIVPSLTAHGTGRKGPDIASAATLTLPEVGTYFVVTGTTSVMAISARRAGAAIDLTFDAGLTLVHNPATLILPGGASIVAAAGDNLRFIALGGGAWRCVSDAEAATQSSLGSVILADQAKVDARTSTTAAVTPASLAHGLGLKGPDIASAATLVLPAVGDFFHVTGTATITAISTRTAGRIVTLRFAAALTLTHNATSLILPSEANIATAANDVAQFVSEAGGNWRCVHYTRSNGITVTPQNLAGGAAVTALSGHLALTASSAKFQSVSSTVAGRFVVLPDATTIPNTGGEIFVITNTGSSSIAVRNSVFDLIAILDQGETVFIYLINNSTLAGVWSAPKTLRSSNVVVGSAFVAFSGAVSGRERLARLDGNRAVLLYRRNSDSGNFLRVVRVNSDKTITLGTEVSLGIGGGGDVSTWSATQGCACFVSTPAGGTIHLVAFSVSDVTITLLHTLNTGIANLFNSPSPVGCNPTSNLGAFAWSNGSLQTQVRGFTWNGTNTLALASNALTINSGNTHVIADTELAYMGGSTVGVSWHIDNGAYLAGYHTFTQTAGTGELVNSSNFGSGGNWNDIRFCSVPGTTNAIMSYRNPSNGWVSLATTSGFGTALQVTPLYPGAPFASSSTVGGFLMNPSSGVAAVQRLQIASPNLTEIGPEAIVLDTGLAGYTQMDAVGLTDSRSLLIVRRSSDGFALLFLMEGLP
jgi:hypothetical protein